MESKKAQIFKTAWAIFKTEKLSFSDSLKKAWEFSKNAFFKIGTTWNNKTVPFCGTTMGDFKATANTLQRLYEMFVNHKPVNNSGAEAWYGCGRYNGD